MRRAKRPVWQFGRNADTIVNLLIFTTILGFVYNLTRMQFIKHTSSTTSALGANFKVLLLLLLSFAIFGVRLNAINVVGMVITGVGFALYTYSRWRARSVMPPPPSAP